jgi:flagellar biosynthesis/type III secretory pathway chaperone
MHANRNASGAESRLMRLAEILEEEAGAYEEMLALASAERRHLVARDLDRLRETVAAKEALIARIDRIEGARREAVGVVTERLTGAARTLTISEILAHLHGPERDRIAALRTRILDEIARIQRINNTNAYLIGSSLELISDELSLLSAGEESGYDGRGDTEPRRDRMSLLDRRA